MKTVLDIVSRDFCFIRKIGKTSVHSFALRTAMVGLIVGLAVSGCGRKGPLEAPDASVSSNAQSDPQTATVPIPKKSNAKEDKTKQKNRPFFLDFLL